jgi:hypothetical protein
MTSNRWVAIDTDILDHPLVGAGQSVPPADPTRGSYSRMEAWIWMICNASFKDHYIQNGDKQMTLKRGDLLGGWLFLATKFNWSRKTVRTWVEKLIEDKMLEKRAMELQDEVARGAAFYGNQANILTVCNYDRYQFSRPEEGQPNSEGNQKDNQNGNQKGNHSAELSVSKIADKYISAIQQGQPEGQAEGQPKGQYITRDIHNNINNTPLTPQGGIASEPAQLTLVGEVIPPDETQKRSRKIPVSDAREVDAAIIAYNAAAKLNGFACIEAKTPQRLARLSRRLKDIGGLDNFKRALAVIPESDFLMGRTIPKGWSAPFRLDFDRLLQTGGGLGDVLGKLLDKAANAGSEMIGPNGKRYGWWREKERELRALPAGYWRELIAEARPNGTWPWWLLTAPPGDPECLVHPDVLTERGLVEIYKGRISHD